MPSSRSRRSSCSTAAIAKTPTGIVQFDRMTQGGLPKARTTLVIGGPGTGKTVFALEVLVHGARDQGEPGVFVSVEEPVERVRQNAAGFNWRIDTLGEYALGFLDATPPIEVSTAGPFDINGLLVALEARAHEMRAKRIVIDGIDMMLSMLDDPVRERQELRRLHEWIRAHDYTVLITAKIEGKTQPEVRRYQFLEYLSDTVVELASLVNDISFVRVLTIPKYRGSDCAPGPYPFVISPSGMRLVYPGASQVARAPRRKLAGSGVARLDRLLGGGYLTGRTVLVSGQPGTAKSSLGAAFVDAGCRNGERSLIVSFDEPAERIVANMQSIGIDLAKHVKSDALSILSLHANNRNAAQHFADIEAACECIGPHRLVIDPISALLKLRGYPFADLVVESLLAMTRERGITLFCTTLDQVGTLSEEATASHVSTIADTWLHLANANLGGERNRCLTIVKSRGMAHSSQTRELILGDNGISLADIYTAKGEVLMGTARAEREMEDRRQESLRQLDFEQKRLRLEGSIAECHAKGEDLSRAVERDSRELVLLDRAEKNRQRFDRASALNRQRLRRSD